MKLPKETRMIAQLITSFSLGVLTILIFPSPSPWFTPEPSLMILTASLFFGAGWLTEEAEEP